MEHVSSARPTGKFPEKVENLKRWARFPGWNFRAECRVPFTFLVVCITHGPRSGTATYRGLRPNGTTFYQSEIPLLLPPKFPGFFLNWKRPLLLLESVYIWCFVIKFKVFTFGAFWSSAKCLHLVLSDLVQHLELRTFFFSTQVFESIKRAEENLSWQISLRFLCSSY